MKSNPDEILEKIKIFEIEIVKATSVSNIMTQYANLESVYSVIVKYLRSDVKNADPNSRIIEMIIGRLEYIKRNMKYKSHKDTNKAIKINSEIISDISNELTSEMKVLKGYVTDGDIT